MPSPCEAVAGVGIVFCCCISLLISGSVVLGIYESRFAKYQYSTSWALDHYKPVTCALASQSPPGSLYFASGCNVTGGGDILEPTTGIVFRNGFYLKTYVEMYQYTEHYNAASSSCGSSKSKSSSSCYFYSEGWSSVQQSTVHNMNYKNPFPPVGTVLGTQSVGATNVKIANIAIAPIDVGQLVDLNSAGDPFPYGVTSTTGYKQTSTNNVFYRGTGTWPFGLPQIGDCRITISIYNKKSMVATFVGSIDGGMLAPFSNDIIPTPINPIIVPRAAEALDVLQGKQDQLSSYTWGMRGIAFALIFCALCGPVAASEGKYFSPFLFCACSTVMTLLFMCFISGLVTVFYFPMTGLYILAAPAAAVVLSVSGYLAILIW
jgi:hypothetical protein